MAVPESFETLWECCTANRRAVPMPLRWRALYQTLRDTREVATGEWEPRLPLIRHAWSDSTPAEKQLCFREHVQWAADHGQIEEIGRYLRSLGEEEWYHFPEQ